MRAITLFLALGLPLASFAQIKFPLEAPTPVVGDRYKFVSLDGLSRLQTGWREEVVSAVGSDAVLASVKSASGELPPARYDSNLNEVFDLKGGPEKAVKLSFPLEPGKTWDSQWKWISARGHDGRMEMSYKVSGTERIKVPAGEFDTVLIEGQGRWYNTTTGSSGVAMEKRWYAPETRRVVRRTWVTRFAAGQPDQNLIVEATEVELKK